MFPKTLYTIKTNNASTFLEKFPIFWKNLYFFLFWSKIDLDFSIKIYSLFSLCYFLFDKKREYNSTFCKKYRQIVNNNSQKSLFLFFINIKSLRVSKLILEGFCPKGLWKSLGYFSFVRNYALGVITKVKVTVSSPLLPPLSFV